MRLVLVPGFRNLDRIILGNGKRLVCFWMWNFWTLHQVIEMIFGLVQLLKVGIVVAQLLGKVDCDRKLHFIAVVSSLLDIFAKSFVVWAVEVVSVLGVAFLDSCFFPRISVGIRTTFREVEIVLLVCRVLDFFLFLFILCLSDAHLL